VLEYTNHKIEGRVRISPSSLFGLYDNPSKWYKNTVLGIKDSPNMSMVVGTILHDRLHRFYQGLEPDIGLEVEYLSTFGNNPEIDEWKIRDVIEETFLFLAKEHLPLTIKPMKMEEYVQYIPQSNPNIFVGGTYDYMYHKDGKVILGDYKTTGTLYSEIKTHHWLQLLAYAWLLKFQNIIVDKIEITYIRKYDEGTISSKTGKRIGLKYPEVSVIQQDITEDDLGFIQRELVNIGKRITLCKQDSNLVDLVFPLNYLSHF